MQASSFPELFKKQCVTKLNREGKTKELINFVNQYKLVHKLILEAHSDLADPDDLFDGLAITKQAKIPVRKNDELMTHCQCIIDVLIGDYDSICEASKIGVDHQLPWLSYYHSNGMSAMQDGTQLKTVLQSMLLSRSDWSSEYSKAELNCKLFVEFLLEGFYTPEAVIEFDACDSNDMRNIVKKARLYKALDDTDEDLKHDIALNDFMRHFQNSLIPDCVSPNKYYMRGFSFLNSSGMGKSRLLRNVGRHVPSFNITLKRVDAKGQSLPEPDSSVCRFLQEYTEEKNFLGHVVAAAFLSALFHELYVYVAHVYDPPTVFFPLDGPFVSENSGAILGQAADNMIKAKRCIDKFNSRKSLIQDICKGIFHDMLRSREHHNRRRNFLDSVILLACAILQTHCSELLNPDRHRISNPDTYYKRRKLGDDKEANPTYLVKCLLIQNMERFFELIDGTSDGLQGCLSKICDDEKVPLPNQFIFGIDECHHLDSLIYAPDYDDKNRPQGSESFLHVFHDLEIYDASYHGDDDSEDTPQVIKNKSTGQTTDFASEPRRRVWLAFLSTSSYVSLFDSEREKRITQTSIRGECCDIFPSRWIQFGMNHALRMKLIKNKGYLDDLTIRDTHHFKHLKLRGRGIWDPEGCSELLKLGFVKLVLALPSDFAKVKILRSIEFFKVSKERLSADTYAIASIRFNLDGGQVKPEQRDDFDCFSDRLKKEQREDYDLIQKSISQHMRHLDLLVDKEGGLITSTPAEPMLSIASLAIMNHCTDIFDRWIWRENGVEKMREGEWKGSRTNHAWENLLRELVGCFAVNAKLVNVGDTGELLGRIILTRARDLTLPEEWNFSTMTSVPFTTLDKFIECLINDGSKDYAKEVLDRLDKINPLLRHSLINFCQFIPLEGPFRDEFAQIEQDEPLRDEFLISAFRNCCAIICKANEIGTDHIIPILVPKSGEVAAAPPHEMKVSDYDISYIKIDDNFLTTAQSASRIVPSLPVINRNGVEVQRCASIVITMDKGTGKRFNNLCDKPHNDASVLEIRNGPLWEERKDCPKCCDCISNCIKADIQERNDQKLALRIRGFNDAYPGMKQIDKDDQFEKAARKAMTFKIFHYPDSATFRSVHSFPSLEEWMRGPKNGHYL